MLAEHYVIRLINYNSSIFYAERISHRRLKTKSGFDHYIFVVPTTSGEPAIRVLGELV